MKTNFCIICISEKKEVAKTYSNEPHYSIRKNHYKNHKDIFIYKSILYHLFHKRWQLKPKLILLLSCNNMATSHMKLICFCGGCMSQKTERNISRFIRITKKFLFTEIYYAIFFVIQVQNEIKIDFFLLSCNMTASHMALM